MTSYDFHTAENVERPHVGVYDTASGEDLVTIVLDGRMTLPRAEMLAELIITLLHAADDKFPNSL